MPDGADGLGMALVEKRMVREELASGKLVAPFGFRRFPDRLVGIPVGTRGRPEISRRFVDWLIETLEADEKSSAL